MTDPRNEHTDTAALRARIAELESDNRSLAARVAATTDEPAVDAAALPRRGGRWRAFLSAVCIVLASVLVPVSVVGAWARAELVDTDRFVSTFGPLVEDPAVQAMIVDESTAAILERVDVRGITDDLFDGLASLDLAPRALAALDLLREPAAEGVQSLVRETVTRVVSSDAFADVWDGALRVTHRAVVASATGGGGGAVTIDDAGVIGIELGPIIAEVKNRLLDRGVGFASAIPAIERTVVLAQSDALVTVRIVYAIAVAVGWWLPVVALLLFAAGIVLARRRSTALLGSGVGLALGSGVLVAGLGVGNAVLGMVAAEVGVSSAALAAIYEQVIAAMRQTAAVGVVVGIVVAALAWTRGRSTAAQRLRRGVDAVNDGIRGALAHRGLTSGPVGAWMDQQHGLVRVILVVAGVAWLWLLRPLQVAETLVVVLVVALVWWLCELLRAPVPRDTSASEPEPLDRELALQDP